MRRASRVVVAAVAAMLLVGCSADTETPDTATPDVASTQGVLDDDSAVLANVMLGGEFGAVPLFEFTPPLTVGAEVARVASPGTGDTVAAGDAVTMWMASVSGSDGAAQGNNYDEAPELLLASDVALPQTLLDVLVGERVGARLLYAAPDEEGGTILYSFEVVSTEPVLARAEGAAVDPAAGLPAVTLADDGRPALEPVADDPPAGLVAQPLIVGDGAPLTETSWIVVRYGSWLWNGTETNSTWGFSAPYAMPLAETHEGWRQGLLGQTVGSQVLLIVPPELAFGDDETEGVPAGSTLVFVIDILAAV